MRRKTIIIMSILTIVFIGFVTTSIALLYGQYIEKQNGDIYIIIAQYDVENGIIIDSQLKQIFLDEKFTDDLTFYQRIETSYGYNVVEVKNGVVKVLESDCPNPHSLNGCMHHSLNNKKSSFFTQNTLVCMQHGLVIKLEVRNEN